MSADPPRRPPGSQLFRSKSYHGPPRRGKRGREVLEDITWIVNDPSSWQHQQQTGVGQAGVLGLGIEAVEEARADGLQQRASSSANIQDGDNDEQVGVLELLLVMHRANLRVVYLLQLLARARVDELTTFFIPFPSTKPGESA